MTSLAENLKPAFTQVVLSIADDKLMLGHRNSDWTGLAPILEEDIAFSSLAQDEIAHAMALYQLLEPIVGETADNLAFGRTVDEYRCATIVVLPDEFDWATAIARQFFCDHFDRLRLERLSQSSYKPAADLASRQMAEEQVHVEHVDAWVSRLGRGGDDAHARLQSALDQLAPIAPMLFETVKDQQTLEGGLYPGCGPEIFAQWRDQLQTIAGDAGLALELTAPDDAGAIGGRRGRHSEHLTTLLDEMCEVYRLEPGAAW